MVFPVLNEEFCLEQSVLEAYDFLQKPGIAADIVISDNNSRDHTPDIAKRLAEDYPGIHYVLAAHRGKGNAVMRAWTDAMFDDYDFFSFMDSDLSTDLEAFPRMIWELETSADVVIGSRYLPSSEVQRSAKREFISRGYRFLFRLFYNSMIKDPQCGFKGVTKDVRDYVVPKIRHGNFFFDTELLIRSQDQGYKITQIPVKWTEDPDSSLNLKKDIPLFIRGLIKPYDKS